MSFNRELVYQDIDMNGHRIINTRPLELDSHPNRTGLFKGFHYYNTAENIMYYYDGADFLEYGGGDTEVPIEKYLTSKDPTFKPLPLT